MVHTEYLFFLEGCRRRLFPFMSLMPPSIIY
jgi:hypothetical protein